MSPTSTPQSQDIKKARGFFKNQSRIPATHHYKKLSLVALGLLMVAGAGWFSKDYVSIEDNNYLPGNDNFVTQSVIDCSNTTVTGIPQSECEALVTLYNATNGPNWTTKTNWLDTNKAVSTWYGITVTNGRVKSIDLYSNQLIGSIPAELNQLANLTNLYLQGNQLTGPIPTELSQLTNLTNLYLYNNQLSGPIPAELSQLTNLKVLLLSNNQLTGPIPAELSQLTNLIFIWLQNNQLCGKVPKSITALISTTINIDQNNLVNLRSQYNDRSVQERGFLQSMGIADDTQILSQIQPQECGATSNTCLHPIAINVHRALKSSTTRIITGTVSNVASMTFSYWGINGSTTDTITISNGTFSKEIIFGPGAENVIINATPTDTNCSNYSQTITCSTNPPPTTITCYMDGDGDTWTKGNGSGFNDTCPGGWTKNKNAEDCNDMNASIYPGAVEILDNNIDENCDGILGTSPNISCTGNDPLNASLCLNDDQGLSINTNKSLVASCTTAKKCEYICNNGFVFDAINKICVETTPISSCDMAKYFDVSIPNTGLTNTSISFDIIAKRDGFVASFYSSDAIYLEVFDSNYNPVASNLYSIFESNGSAYIAPTSMNNTDAGKKSYSIIFDQAGIYTIQVSDNTCVIQGATTISVSEGGTPPTPDPNICSNGVALSSCRNFCISSQGSTSGPIIIDPTTCIQTCMCLDMQCKEYCGGTTPSCGNAKLEKGEQCDDGNKIDTDYCTNLCQKAICGDTIVGPGEQCDDGSEKNGHPESECSSTCQKQTPTPPICVPTTGQEKKETNCADKYDNDCDTLIDAKDPDCINTIPKSCGNKIVESGEECDDGNNHNNDGCNQYCKYEGGFGGGAGGTNYCGDGLQRSTEQCDDGNYISGDGCDSNCKLENGKNPTQPPSNRLIVDAIKKMIINLQNNCAYHDKDYYEILQKYKDIRNDDYRDPAVILTTFCITNGYNRKGSLGFNMNQYASIYETIKIITKINAISEGVQFDEKHPDLIRVPYRDVNKGWFTDYVNYAHDLGILDGAIQGKELKGFTPIMTNQLETMLTNVGKDTTPYPVFFKNSKIKRDEMAEIIVDVFKEKFVYAEYMMGENIKFYELVLKQLQGKTPLEQEAFIKNLVERMKNRDKDELETGLNIYLDGVIKFFNAVIATK